MTRIIGIDVGGTFTDLVAVEADGSVVSAKTPTVRQRQEQSVLTGLQLLAERRSLTREAFLDDVSLIVHGTTMATNALLERRGARTALLTTEGFRDELAFRRGFKESVFDVRLPAPPVLVPRARRRTVAGRLAADGAVLTELDEGAVREIAAELREDGVEAVAVGFLFSFADGRHERRAAEILAEELPDAFVTASADVLPQIREYERLSTTVVNGYVSPELKRYLEALQGLLSGAGFGGELLILQSGGGVLSPEATAARGVGTLLSGPAGGIAAARDLGAQLGHDHLITADMGGTSFDVGLITGGTAEMTTDTWINRQRIALPMLDIHTIGAGGGSIAWVDDGGSVQVGPESAGAEPGPACYGRGGTRPTVTDADLVLGYIDPEDFLGGSIRLDVAAARDAIAEHVATPLGLGIEEAAATVFEIANGSMANAIRFVTTQRGVDPEGFALVAMGGAGAIHAGLLAAELEIGLVVVPAESSFFCAHGCTLADLSASVVRTFLADASAVDRSTLNATLSTMEDEARARIGDALELAEEVRVERHLDLRYRGEVHELTVPVPSRSRQVTDLNLRSALAAFHDLHHQKYAHQDPQQEVEILGLRVDVIGRLARPRTRVAALGDERPDAGLIGRRAVYLPATGTLDEVPVYDDERLEPGCLIEGPAVVQRRDTTIVLHPGQEALLDGRRNWQIELATGPSR